MATNHVGNHNTLMGTVMTIGRKECVCIWGLGTRRFGELWKSHSLCWKDPTPREEENLQLNDQALNVIYKAQSQGLRIYRRLGDGTWGVEEARRFKWGDINGQRIQAIHLQWQVCKIKDVKRWVCQRRSIGSMTLSMSLEIQFGALGWWWRLLLPDLKIPPTKIWHLGHHYYERRFVGGHPTQLLGDMIT